MNSKTKNNLNKHFESFKLTKRNAWFLWCSQLLNIVSLSAEISSWMLAIIALCLCWQALLINLTSQVSKVKVTPVLLKTLAISGCIAIAITAKSSGVLLSMVHLLTFAYILKAFEIKQRKDFYQLFLLGLFLLASAFIFKQDLVFSLFIAFALVVNLVVLQQVFAKRMSLVRSTKTVVILLLQSSLLAIFLFVVFPRLSPFWQVPNSKSAKTGLSDEVSPGDIANLALSSDLAFRVDFKGTETPPYSDLYWRAMTLENYDGRKWSRADVKDNTIKTEHAFVPFTSGKSIAYEIIAEASFQPWLFGLTVATIDDTKLKLLKDYTIQSRNILSQIKYYQIKSYIQAPIGLYIGDEDKQRNLAIIEGSNPRLEQLAQQLIAKHPNPIDRSNAVLALFRSQNYFYTLKPPLLNDNSLDQFFFDTKAGFCVHYASAYAYLMRAAGIPARIVTGYLGGEYNSTNSSQDLVNTRQGGHLSVYQYDAHAWAEIWIDGTGWYRVDPTAAVDPQRVSSGWSTTLLTQQSSLNNDLLGLYQLKKIAWLNSLRLQFDALDYQWTRWVIGYSSKQQYNLLKRWFGDNIQWKAAILFFLMFSGLMILFTLIYRFDFSVLKRNKVAPWVTLYSKLTAILAKKGLTKPINMTPADFAKKVGLKHPELSKEIMEFTKVFELLMYQDLSHSEQEINIIIIQKQYLTLNELIATR